MDIRQAGTLNELNKNNKKKKMNERGRQSGEGYCIQIIIVNGQVREDLALKSFYLENISKGGFRFQASIELQEEDRLQVLLRFPDESTKEVFGRICYINRVDDFTRAYGFSVLDGFYQLKNSSAN